MGQDEVGDETRSERKTSARYERNDFSLESEPKWFDLPKVEKKRNFLFTPRIFATYNFIVCLSFLILLRKYRQKEGGPWANLAIVDPPKPSSLFIVYFGQPGTIRLISRVPCFTFEQGDHLTYATILSFMKTSTTRKKIVVPFDLAQQGGDRRRLERIAWNGGTNNEVYLLVRHS
ncbi:hypothetical protein KPH14_005351 [Odynerus spinipes]|uniref:Uncharacterized protein n=1 Tax=Odynerus spinipes TaxID=1348599 RepID=A0AAD9RBK3_9HYME|nr:hypothetical protein KPH14_005351 [Odynerus spinipes]